MCIRDSSKDLVTTIDGIDPQIEEIEAHIAAFKACAFESFQYLYEEDTLDLSKVKIWLERFSALEEERAVRGAGVWTRLLPTVYHLSSSLRACLWDAKIGSSREMIMPALDVSIDLPERNPALTIKSSTPSSNFIPDALINPYANYDLEKVRFESTYYRDAFLNEGKIFLFHYVKLV